MKRPHTFLRVQELDLVTVEGALPVLPNQTDGMVLVKLRLNESDGDEYRCPAKPSQAVYSDARALPFVPPDLAMIEESVLDECEP